MKLQRLGLYNDPMCHGAYQKAYSEHTTTSNLCDHVVYLLERDLSAFLSYDSVVLICALSLLLVCVLCSCVHFYSPPYSGFNCNHLCKA
jgi:hypothetical protein